MLRRRDWIVLSRRKHMGWFMTHFIRALRKMFRKATTVEGVRLGRQMIGDRYVEDSLYIEYGKGIAALFKQMLH